MKKKTTLYAVLIAGLAASLLLGQNAMVRVADSLVAKFASQGTTTTLLHGNASGNLSWAQVGLTTDVTGVLPGANGGGEVLLEQHTASSSATLDFTTCLTSAYDTYKVTFTNISPATNTQILLLRVSTNGGSTYDSANNYEWSGSRYSSIPDNVGAGNASDTSISLSAGAGIDNSLAQYSGTFIFYDPLNASYYKSIVGQGIGPFISTGIKMSTLTFSGSYKSASAVNAFRILYASGNIASGAVRCYGLAK